MKEQGIAENRPKNPSEQLFYDTVTAKGWELIKTGWPDFVCWGPDGQFILVEIKAKRSHRLKGNQLRIMRALAAYGIDCYRWSPAGFEKITPRTKEPMPRTSPWRRQHTIAQMR